MFPVRLEGVGRLIEARRGPGKLGTGTPAC